jgi:NhaP-type Na+/H+ or K+/H+ antiporter
VIVVAMLAGLALGTVAPFDAHSPFVEDIAVVALVVILFRDGLEVESEMLQRGWRPPLAKLVVGMPVTAAIVALAAKALTSLSWTEAFLLGAILAPTDPVLSNAVVTNPRVPRLVRHSLNLESGLNDGLALTPVLALTAALDPSTHDFHVWTFVLRDVGGGVLCGLVLGALAALLAPARGRTLYALAAAAGIYAVTVLLPHGNGLLAVFTGAIVVAVRRPGLHVDDRVVEALKLGVFLVFGALLTFGHGATGAALAAVTLLVARPAAVWLSLAGTGLDRATKWFMAWFGPKGIATVAFSLLVLHRGLAAGQELFDLAAIVVACSVVVHSLSDARGAEWLARRQAAA